MEQKNIFLGILCFFCMVDMTNVAFIVPILPDFLIIHGISLTMIGFILSFYQISNFFTCLYLSKKLMYYSKYNVIVLGQFILISSNLALGFINYCDNANMIVFCSIIIRFIQGIALALVTSTIYAYVPALFPLNIDEKYALMEIFQGTGLALGPVIGGFLYEYLKYTYSFVIIAIVYATMAIVFFPIIYKYNKNMINEKNAEKPDQNNGNLLEEQEPLKTLKILKNRNFILTLFIFIFSLMTYMIIQPGFSDHVHAYNGTEDTVGLLFGLGDILYAFTGVFMIHFIKKNHIKRKYLFIFGGFLSGLSLLILGPDDYTYLPKNLTSIAIGMVILGVSQMIYVPILIPEFIEIFNEIDPLAKGNDEMACGLFNASISATQFIGSILGGYLSELCGFNRGMAIYAMVLFAFLIIFGFCRKVNIDKKLIKENKIDAELSLLDENESKI